MLLGTSLPEYYTMEEFAELNNVEVNIIRMRVYRNTINYYRLGTGKRTTVLIPKGTVLNAPRARKTRTKEN